MKKRINFFVSVILVFLMLLSTALTGYAENQIQDAEEISIGDSRVGNYTESNKKAYYKFTLDTSGKITVKYKTRSYRTKIYIYDSNLSEVWHDVELYTDSVSGECNKILDIDLTSGEYYICFEYGYGDYSQYDFNITFSSANESFAESLEKNDNSYQTANDVSFDTDYYGQIASNDEKDFYKISLDKSGRINIDITAFIYRVSYFLYDENGNTLYENFGVYYNDVTQQSQMDLSFDLVAGDYYFCVCRRNGTGNYNFNVAYTRAFESFEENQSSLYNLLELAPSIDFSKEYTGQLAKNDDVDFYKITIKQADKYTVRATGNFEKVRQYIYDSKGNEIVADSVYWNDTAKRYYYTKELELSAGTYYICMRTLSYCTGVYTFSISPSSSGYRVSFDAAGGHVSESAVWVQDGEKVTFPTPDARSGYKFLGWAESSFSTSADYYAGDKIEVTEDKIFYAVWEKSSVPDPTPTPDPEPTPDPNPEPPTEYYTVTFYYDDTENESFTVASGGTVTFPTPNDRDGYTFKGWDESSAAVYPTYKAGDKLTVSGDCSFYAIWEKSSEDASVYYDVNLISSKGGLDNDYAKVKQGESTILPTPNVTFVLSYDASGGESAPDSVAVKLECKGWSYDNNDTTGEYNCSDIFYPNEDTTLYAIFADGASVTLSRNVPKRDGYKFLGWSLEPDSQGIADYKPGDNIKINSDTALYAVWELKSDFLRGDADGDGRVSASDARTALRIAARLEAGTASQIAACDLNSDGKVTANEARAILRYAARLDSVL